MNGKSILIVEDDKDIRELLRESLEGEGYHACAVSNGQEALDILPQLLNPALILLDLMTPVMNGWQFLEARTKNQDLASIPVVIISAASSEKINSITDAGVTNVLKKPIDLDRLLNCIKDVERRSKG